MADQVINGTTAAGHQGLDSKPDESNLHAMNIIGCYLLLSGNRVRPHTEGPTSTPS